MLFHKKPGQGENILWAIPQWGEVEFKDIETVEQIFPECPFFYLGFEIAVGCGKNPGIGTYGSSGFAV